MIFCVIRSGLIAMAIATWRIWTSMAPSANSTSTGMTTSGTTIAVSSLSATLFIFPPIWWFYFIALIHPPSILPTSFNFSEIFMYFLSSKDFISQEICRKNFSKSNLTEAFFREINFSNLSELLAFIIFSITSKNKESILAPRVYRESFEKFSKNSCHNS